MTLIAAVVEDGKIWMAGDRLVHANGLVQIAANPKVIKRGELLIGICGQYQIHDAVEHWCDFGDAREHFASDLDYMARSVQPRLRQCFDERQAITKDSDGDTVIRGSLLIGYRGVLYTAGSCFDMTPYGHGYSADGETMATMIAMGVLATNDQMPPRSKLLKAMEMAHLHSLYVRPPFDVICSHDE